MINIYPSPHDESNGAKRVQFVCKMQLVQSVRGYEIKISKV